MDYVRREDRVVPDFLRDLSLWVVCVRGWHRGWAATRPRTVKTGDVTPLGSRRDEGFVCGIGDGLWTRNLGTLRCVSPLSPLSGVPGLGYWVVGGSGTVSETPGCDLSRVLVYYDGSRRLLSVDLCDPFRRRHRPAQTHFEPYLRVTSLEKLVIPSSQEIRVRWWPRPTRT